MSLAQAYEFKYPSQQKLCEKHRLATRIWKGILDENKAYEICECCGRKVGEVDVAKECCYDSDQLSFLGVGLPLFFSYLRYSILLLVVLALVFCVFGLYSNVVSRNCLSDNQCTQNIFNTLSIVNKKNSNNYLSIQNYILLTFVVLCIFIFQFFRYRFRKIEDQIDELVASPSDYSLILKRLPENTTESDIMDMIDRRRGFLDEEEKVVSQNLKVQKIVMSYDLKELNEDKEMYLDQFREMIKKGQAKEFTCPELSKPTVPGYIAIVVFSKQQSKQFFIQQPKFNQRVLHYFLSPCSPLSDQTVKNERVCIQRAPQPDDILWDNAYVTVFQGIRRKMMLWTISFILLVAGGLAQYGLALMQKEFKDDDTKRILVGTLASVVVSITNLILQYFLIYTTFWQRMATMTEYADVLNFKLVFQQFLNAGIFVVAANIAANYETFNLQSTLSQTIIQIMILNAITPNISTFLIYKFDISGRLMRYFCLQKECSIYTQLQANQLYMLPQPSLPQKYSFVIKTIWLTSFYAPFTPIVVPISVCGLVFNYFLEKALFGSAYSAPNMISAEVNDGCIELFEYVPLILSIGEFLIYWYFKKFNFNAVPINWSVPIWLSIGISLISLIVPMKNVNKALCTMKPDLSNEPTYNQAEKDFEVTYEITNPAFQLTWTRLWDSKMWRKQFRRVPTRKNLELKEYDNPPLSSDRKISNPFLHTFGHKYKNYQ